MSDRYNYGPFTAVFPTDRQARKEAPMATGVLDYFPDALFDIAGVSFAGNEQHNPGEPLHWAKEKSKDHADTIIRHLAERGKRDTDGRRHSAKLAWRALALLQTEIEEERIKASARPVGGSELSEPSSKADSRTGPK